MRRLLTAAGLTGMCGLISFAAAQTPPSDYAGSCTKSGCHDAYANQAVIHAPVEQEACDTCHEAEAGADHRFALAQEQPDLCTDCHDEVAKGKVVHQPVAAGSCTTCHDPHASKSAALIRADSIAALCTDCHDELTEDMKFLHGPVASGNCDACHRPHASDHPSLLKAEGRTMCFECHDDVEERIADGSTVHSPVAGDCTTCHHPHGGAHPMMLEQAPPELCLDCHEDLVDRMADSPVKHDALRKDKPCGQCHDAHASGREKLLTASSMTLCLSCHEKEVVSAPAAGGPERRIAAIGALLESSPDHHGPIRTADCVTCHLAHGGAHPRMLVETYPDGFYAPFATDRYALCFDCHDAELAEEAQTDEATGFRNGEQNLHHLHVHKDPKGRSCGACHDPHAAPQAKHIRSAVPFGAWAIPIRFEATSTGGTCLPGCHRRYRYDREQAVENLPDA
jgi:predicted CXXCH cytochrome family protein